MIRSFGDRDTEMLFNRDVSRRWQAFARVALRRLRLLHRTTNIESAFVGVAAMLTTSNSPATTRRIFK
jgi:plasmid maintenance system killer protein